jgi:hypothetical protein
MPSIFALSLESLVINVLIAVRLKINLSEKLIPKLFKFSIARVFVESIKPFFLASSKHPFTVRVSNPNEFFNKKCNEALGIVRSGFELV